MRKIALSGITCVVLSVWTFLFLLPRSAAAQQLCKELMLFSVRTSHFAHLAFTRDEKCALSEAWNHAIEADSGARIAEIQKACKRVRSDGPLDLYETPAGPFWIPAHDSDALAEVLEEQDRDIYGVKTGTVRPGDVVLDCGANVGVYSRRALQAGARLVVAIEPGPEALAALRRNLADAIAAGKAVVYPKGVWDKDETLRLKTSPDQPSTANTVALDHGQAGPTIQLTTIDKMAAELNLPRVDSIKMDIEGAEPKALAGGRLTIAKYRPRMAISLEHTAKDPQQIPALVKSLWPDRSAECGPCHNLFGRIQPEVAFVR